MASNPKRLVTEFVDGRWKSVPRMLPVLLGMTREATERSLCFITDGGHRENLGVVQLLLRRCKLIIAIDAGHDPAHSFDDLARVLRSSEIHLGTTFKEINAEGRLTGMELRADELHLRSGSHQTRTRQWVKSDGKEQEQRNRATWDESSIVGQHYILARIVYPCECQDAKSPHQKKDPNSPEDFNLFVYVKPSLTGDESELIKQYRATNIDFPQESTLDQNYSPEQFEAYRKLGKHIGEDIALRFSPVNTKDDWWECTETAKVSELIDAFLERQWVLRKPKRLVDDYAYVLMNKVNDEEVPLDERRRAAAIFRQVHNRDNIIMEPVRALADRLKSSESLEYETLLVDLGPLALLPVLALFRRVSTEHPTRKRCLEVLKKILFDRALHRRAV